jgi:ribosome-binding ATPase YchF (GTP1/OBG family)
MLYGAERSCLTKITEKLNAGLPARAAKCSEEELKLIKSLGLLTLKPIIYAANVADNDLVCGWGWGWGWTSLRI